MSSQEEYDEHLEDPLIIIGVGPSTFHKEYDVEDIITTEDEVVIDTCNYNRKIFDEYINAFVKDTSILPYSFSKIKENLEFLDLCRPLSIRVADCNKFPWYERDMGKIIHNEDLEKNIQWKQNNVSIDSKFKEIIGNKGSDTFDANNVTSCKRKSKIKIFDIDDKEISDLINDSCFDSINESQNNKSSICYEIDDFVMVNDIYECPPFDNVIKPKRKKTREATPKKNFKLCKKIDCISLSVDKKTQLFQSKKIVPHYHEKKDDIIITNDLNLNERQANCKVKKEHGTNRNNKKKPKSIPRSNKEILMPNQNVMDHTYTETENGLEKYSTQLKNSKTKSTLTKQPKKNNMLNSTKKKIKEKLVTSIKELQDKYFSNSSSLVTKKGTVNPSLSYDGASLAKASGVEFSSNNLCHPETPSIYIVNNSNKHNLFRPKINDSLLKSNERYIPYLVPNIDNQNTSINLSLKSRYTTKVSQTDTPRNNLHKKYEYKQAKHSNIDEKNNEMRYTENVLINNSETLRHFLPNLYKSHKTCDNPKSTYIELEHTLKSSREEQQQGYKTLQNNEKLIANVSMENTILNIKTNSDNTKIKTCNNKNFERNNSCRDTVFKNSQVIAVSKKTIMTCKDQSIPMLSKELQSSSSNSIGVSKQNSISQQNKEQKQTHAYIKEQNMATDKSIHKNSYADTPINDNIFDIIQTQNNNKITEIEEKQITEPITKPSTDSKMLINKQKEINPDLESHCTYHEPSSTSKAVNIRPNLKQINKSCSGYSPPILPIPTYHKAFEILDKINLKSKFRMNMECRDGPTVDAYNENMLLNRCMTMDMLQHTKSSDNI